MACAPSEDSDQPGLLKILIRLGGCTGWSESSLGAHVIILVKAEGKCGGGTTHIWQWRQSVCGEADLHIFGSQDWAKVQKRNCKSLEVQTEMKCGSGTSYLLKSWQNMCGKRNFRSLPVKTERKCGSRTSHIWQARQSGNAEAELHIFGSQCRTKVRTWNFRSLAVKAERKCGSGTSGFWQLRQSRSVEAEFQIFSRQDRAEVQSSTFDSPVKLDVQKQILTDLTGPYPTDCHCQCWRISLLTAILKDNVKTMCG